jgi:hypothetical protein
MFIASCQEIVEGFCETHLMCSSLYKQRGIFAPNAYGIN